jgi:hypothetical protein
MTPCCWYEENRVGLQAEVGIALEVNVAIGPMITYNKPCKQVIDTATGRFFKRMGGGGGGGAEAGVSWSSAQMPACKLAPHVTGTAGVKGTAGVGPGLACEASYIFGLYDAPSGANLSCGVTWVGFGAEAKLFVRGEGFASIPVR